MKKNLLLILIFSLISCTYHKQVFLNNTESLKIISGYNNISYTIHIALPEGYNKLHTYPLLVLLDDTYSFPISTSIVHHLTQRKELPPIIIASIAYQGKETDLSYHLNRTRDYTPFKMKNIKEGYADQNTDVSGGGDLFLDFIQQELLPKLAKKYSLNTIKILAGHSFGGLLALWSTITRPYLFSHTILVSPSIWYNQYQIKTIWNTQKNNLKSFPAVFWSVGKKEETASHNMVQDVQEFYTSYQSKQKRTALFVGLQDNHNTIFPNALTQGLLWIFKP